MNKGFHESIEYDNESQNLTNNITDDKEKNEFYDEDILKKSQNSKIYKPPIFSNIINKFYLSEINKDFGPKFSDVLNADKDVSNDEQLNSESRQYSMKKRNRNKNDSLSDYNSKEDNHTSQTDIKVNKGKNYVDG